MDASKPFPTFYAGGNLMVYKLLKSADPEALYSQMSSDGQSADHIIFEISEGAKPSQSALNRVKKRYPRLKYIKTFQMGNIDRVRFSLNKGLKNFDYALYKVD